MVESSTPRFLFNVVIFSFRTLPLKPHRLENHQLRWQDRLTVGHISFPIWALWWTVFEHKCILCCSTHERHAIYLWNLWKVIQTQYVTQGALLAALWREALQMRGKARAAHQAQARGLACVDVVSRGREACLVRGTRLRFHRAVRPVLWALRYLTAG